MGVPSEEVTLGVLMMKGPYTTARLIYTSCSSHCCPNVSLVQKSMQELQDAGLGEFKVVNKLKIFYKTVPSDDLQPKLAKYNVSVEEYKATFLKEDDRLTANNITTISENHPFQEQRDGFVERVLLPPIH